MGNCDIKMTSSLAGFIPASGLQISSYQILRSINSTFYRETRISTFKPKICPYCGIHFLARVYTKKREQTFCSTPCANKYSAQNIAFKRKQLAYRIVDNKEFAKWFKAYNNIVIGYIYNNFNSEFVEDLIDIWTDKAVIWYRRLINKNKPFRFIKKALSSYEKNLKYNKKEVFYDECNIRTQNYILGVKNYE